MKEHPILFSAPMVRALLDGTKTQTRRVVKPQPADLWPEGVECYSDARGPFRLGPSDMRARLDDCGLVYDAGCQFAGPIACPYGQPGDRLWVREAWRVRGGREYEYQHDKQQVMYRATHQEDGFPLTWESYQWRPSIHMPRWAGRILLEIVSVRVERLNDISEDDAKAEGAAAAIFGFDTTDLPAGAAIVSESHRAGFIALWESINGPGSWNANPWVWVVEFKRVAP